MLNNPFDTKAKAEIRKFDHGVISQFRREHYPGRALSYIGLPGAELLDVMAWREFIGRWAAVQLTNESSLIEAANELELNVMRQNLEREFTMLRGDIDEIISAGSTAGALQWPYEIVNLDYVGGLMHARQDGTSKHLDTIRILFERQNGAKFVLFLTVNLRDKDSGQFDSFLADFKNNLIDSGCLFVNERVDAHIQDFGNAGKLKIYVPLFLRLNAPKYEIVCHAPILYRGSKQMMHFAFECLPVVGNASGSLFALKNQVDIVNLPLITCDDKDDLRSNNLGNLIRLPNESD